MLLPVPILVVLLYHTQLALSPSAPPTTDNVTLVFPQVESAVVVIPVGAVESLFTLMDLDTQLVTLQVPSARTKYKVVTEGETVIEAPVPAGIPPQDAMYHFHVALLPRLPPDTRNVVLPPEQTESTDAVIAVAATDSVFT
jgi:enoyl reductase-like protein